MHKNINFTHISTFLVSFQSQFLINWNIKKAIQHYQCWNLLVYIIVYFWTNPLLNKGIVEQRGLLNKVIGEQGYCWISPLLNKTIVEQDHCLTRSLLKKVIVEQGHCWARSWLNKVIAEQGHCWAKELLNTGIVE